MVKWTKKGPCSVLIKLIIHARIRSTMLKSTDKLKKILLSVETHVFVPD
jgi:hypothetical protein